MKLGRYHILEEIGKGSMGVVFKAHDPQIDRILAVKALRPDRVTSEAFVQRFLKEAQAIGRLSHPNIVTVYDAGLDGDTLFIAMEFLPGHSLKGILEQRQLSNQEIIHIGVEVVEALDYSHQRGIVHRDIKPSNIIINPSGSVKITDFGVAHIEDPNTPAQTVAGEILGTPEYMSPEQVLGKPVDGRTDLYSLGVILYQMTTGKRPFKRENIAATFQAIMQETPEVPKRNASPMAGSLSALIMKSINKAPEQRFQTGSEMAVPLKACLHRRKSDVGGGIRQFDRRPKPRTGLYTVLAMLVLLVIGVLIYTIYTNSLVSVTVPSKPSAMLNVTSDPPEAQVFLDGNFKGKTPLILNLPLGKYEMRLSHSNHHDWDAQIRLDEEKETPLFVKLVPIQQD
jgi:eukaryotic-like serine/threonine-protein kinase